MMKVRSAWRLSGQAQPREPHREMIAGTVQGLSRLNHSRGHQTTEAIPTAVKEQLSGLGRARDRQPFRPRRVKQGGSIVTWGEAKFGGDFCNVQGLDRTQRR